MFRKLRNWLSLPQLRAEDTGFPLPYGLSDAEYKALQRLWKSEDFAVLTKTLDTIVSLYGEQLLAARQPEDFHLLRGKILGLRMLTEFVDELKLKEKDYAIHEQRRDRAKDRSTNARGATFGTPAWKGPKGRRP